MLEEKIQLEIAINQDLQAVQRSQGELERRNVVAARPKSNKSPSPLLHAEKVFARSESFDVEYWSHL